MSVQYSEIGAASAADWGGLLLLHDYEAGSSQQIVVVGVHAFARPQDMLGRLSVPPAMRGGVTVSTLPKLARDTSAQLAIQVFEKVPLPLFVLF